MKRFMQVIMRKSDVIEVMEYEAIVRRGPGQKVDKETFEELEEPTKYSRPSESSSP